MTTNIVSKPTFRYKKSLLQEKRSIWSLLFCPENLPCAIKKYAMPKIISVLRSLFVQYFKVMILKYIAEHIILLFDWQVTYLD